MTSSRLVVYCLLICSHLRCHDLSVVPWTATFIVLWPFLRFMASMAAARRDCLSRSMVSNRLVCMAESGTMFQTMTPAFYIKSRLLLTSTQTALLPILRVLTQMDFLWLPPYSVALFMRQPPTQTTRC